MLWHRTGSTASRNAAVVLRVAFAATLLALTGSGASFIVRSALAQESPFLGQGQSLSETVQRGKYLAEAGDCIACHTKHDGPAFAGGLPMVTPFGTIYSPNITPDQDDGIGNWTADDFYKMLHTGRSRDGTLLYPAMPFPAYTKITRSDSDAIFAYLSSIAPLHVPNRENELRFPYNNRALLLGWRALYLHVGTFQPDPKQGVQWNRGAYLVQGLGHCATCHTPINALGGSSDEKAFAGGLIPMQNWYAPSLTLNREAGLGNWQLTDIVDLLKAGTSMRGAVYGPMAEVVHNSLQYLTDEDVQAMAVYLKSLPANEAAAAEAAPPASGAVTASVLARGSQIYSARCASCHQADGRGRPPAYPPLAQNQSIEMESAVNPIRMVLNGGYPPETAANARPYGMPPFAQVLSDEDIAAVVTYIRIAWGNHGEPVTAADVVALRSAPLFD
jgi:mono/diheme cytochrome c family protein